MKRAERSVVSNKAFNEVPIHSLAKLSYQANRLLNAKQNLRLLAVVLITRFRRADFSHSPLLVQDFSLVSALFKC